MSRVCPICGSRKKEALFELCPNMAVLGGGFPTVKSYNVACQNCGCVYVDADVSQRDFSSYYSATSNPIDYFKMFGKNETLDYYAEILSTFSHRIALYSRILEVGCGTGDFLVYLNSKGYENVSGIDASKKCIEQARAKGVDCSVFDITSAAPAVDKKYDVVILSHTLEHIFDSKTCIENIKQIMAPDALLYIEVPDASRYSDVSLSPFFFLTYEHLTHYSHQALRNLAISSGLKDIAFRQFFKCNKYYVQSGLYKIGRSDCEFRREEDTQAFVRDYFHNSKSQMKGFIDELKRGGQRLILWGIGASTASLLELFDDCDVVQLIDKNTARQGLTFDVSGKTLTTQDPGEVVNDATIVILPEMYANSIAEQIRNMGLRNEIVYASRSPS